MNDTKKRYLGDSVYANFDGYRIILTTENDFESSNTIYLEPGAIEALVDYIKILNGE